MFNRSIYIFFATIAVYSICNGVSAQTKYPENLFSVSRLHFDSVREPHGPIWYLQSPQAQVLISSIAGAMKINSKYIKFPEDIFVTADVKGEETHYKVPIEEGYAYCGTRLHVTSIVPADGERASLINVAVNSKGLEMTTWTAVRHFGEGNAWAEGDVQVYGIKPAFLEEFIEKGVCKRVTEQVGIYSCRGVAACGAGVTHGNPLNAGPSTPKLEPRLDIGF